MTRTLIALALTAVLPLVGCATQTVEPPLTTGETISLAGIKDQHGNGFDHQNTMQTLLFVEGMGAKDIVRDSLQTINTACMQSGELVYLADISGMPSLISNLVAIPSMQEQPYPIWLDRDGTVSQQIPTQAGQVTLLSVDQGRIEQVDYYGSVAELSEPLKQACGTD
ncbi:hypothetical protein [Marinomonas ostreistagni]|uniref:hypothetical protein n=1 Tax=Marinomonas ostreistagni TaxID=359209 RepID=UPI001951E403|nr:hypothetical protein [Marinomonas ostreistagni]MBM6552128.1 hypothetical protein [Marinomonas ostreistagni]